MRKLSVAAAIALALSLNACGGEPSAKSIPAPSAVAKECSGDGNGYLPRENGDDGSIQITNATMNSVVLECVLEELVSDATRQLIMTTTPDMGRQARTENGYRLTWNVDSSADAWGGLEPVRFLTLLIERS